MANPSLAKIKEGRVECVARNVTTGTINFHRANSKDMVFLCTYRMTGQAAPSLATVKAEGFQLFQDGKQAVIENSAAIDIYLTCGNGDSDSDDWGEVIIWT